MGKRIKTLIAAILLSFSSLFAVGCSGTTTIAGIKMSNEEVIDVPFGNFSYDGIKVTVLFENGTDTEIDLTDEMISEVEKLKFYKMGEQDVKVVFREVFSTTMKVNVVLNEFKDIYELVGYDHIYDGQPHSVELNHELPEGAEITYPKGNTFTNIGSYEVIGVITKSGYATKTLKATLNILPNEYDEDGIVFKDKTVLYNGEIQTIEATNVPEGVNVSYTIYDPKGESQYPRAIDAGKYRFVAHFTNDNPNYKQIEDKIAYLTINKIDYDISGISFINHFKDYDGETYTPAILNPQALPDGLIIDHYEVTKDGVVVTDNSPAGVYDMKVYFKGDNNHNEVTPLEATLTVAKKPIYIEDDVIFEGREVEFTGATFSVFEPTGLPNGVNFELSENEFVYAGEYPVTATFTAVDQNRDVDLKNKTVYLVIEPSNSKVEVFDGYDGSNPIYHDFSFKDIVIDVAGNTATIDKETLRLESKFTGFDYGIDTVKDASNHEITFRHLIKDDEDHDVYIEVEPKDFVDGETYTYEVNFVITNDDAETAAKLNESISIGTAAGTFRYGKVHTKSDEYEYEGSFDCKNIIINDGVASIYNVESGVTAKSITITPGEPLTPTTNPYTYKVEFEQQDDALFIAETGSFYYKNVTKAGSTQLFSTENLLIGASGAWVIDTCDGATLRSIVVKEKSSGEIINLTDLVEGNTYTYNVAFNGVSEINNNPGIIWNNTDGEFTYAKVKDIGDSEPQPFNHSNISISGDVVSLVNVNPDVTLNSAEFYLGSTLVPVGELVDGQTYRYVVSFKSTDSTLYAQETGFKTIGTV